MKNNGENNVENQEKNIIINSNVDNAVIQVVSGCDKKIVVSAYQKSIDFDLSKLHPGDRFLDMDGNEYMCLGFTDEVHSAIIVPTKNVGELKFGETNQYSESIVDEFTNSYVDTIQYEFGPNSLVFHAVDLTAVDTTKQQDDIKRMVSLMTYDMYRKYKKLLKGVLNGGFALATPWSDVDAEIACVIFDGSVRPRCCKQSHKIRPYFVLDTHLRYNIALTHVNGESTLKKREVIKNEN